MPGKPYQSCLNPYEDEIIALRRKRPPTPYAQIAELLRKKYQIVVRREAVYSFIKIRAKQSSKTCKYAWSINADNQPVTETPSAQKRTVSQTSKPKDSAIGSKTKSNGLPEVSSFDPSKVEITEYSATWNLHRPDTKEEREAYRQYLREEKLKLEQQKKEN